METEFGITINQKFVYEMHDIAGLLREKTSKYILVHDSCAAEGESESSIQICDDLKGILSDIEDECEYMMKSADQIHLELSHDVLEFHIHYRESDHNDACSEKYEISNVKKEDVDTIREWAKPHKIDLITETLKQSSF
ncbi:MAG: hypothetical protein Hyperionvirus3_2 [Hyperionvirus sp.]|uniref:Uncharacterized protein n=1 Tax=Hyperionvirus sp. TaxID=2487770 RepID=A0A3G5A6H2_9VIRU|nr:MAG: hypothetical protein Hyperionvirus3_2 [Hyperionvirus sp.]